MNIQYSEIRKLSNLRPETVIGLEDVAFSNRAHALPGVLEVSESITDVPYIGDSSGDEIEVASCMNISADHTERMVVMEKHIVVGGLSTDEDCDSPLDDSYANGSIHHRNSRDHSGEEGDFYAAVGFDREGNPDLSDPAIGKEVGRIVWSSVCKDIGLHMSLMRVLKKHRQPSSVEQAIRHATSFGESWGDHLMDAFMGTSRASNGLRQEEELLTPLAALMETSAKTAWDSAVRAGLVGNPMAVLLDIYEHGGKSYSISGHGMQC
jgi:hypothetical protein